jgi:class 3 adenylate cyclase
MALTQAVCPVMVGREDELSRLEDALLAAHRGDGQVVVIAGDAGVGKTRLTGEVQARAERVGFTVLRGGCSEAELALPYLPFLEAVGNHLPSADVAALRLRLGPAARELGRLFPRLSTTDEQPVDSDAAQAKLRLFEAFVDLLSILAEGEGVLLALEDLHWADAATRELLDYLARRIRALRILIVANYRSDEMHRKHPLLPTIQGWKRARLVDTIELDPLGEHGVGRMIGEIFEIADVSPEFRRLLHERSEGNPFVLEELLKEALDRGDIYRTDTGWNRRSIDEIGIPETVRDTILLRLERLPDTIASVLRAAAVAGFVFDPDVVARASDREVSEVDEALREAGRQQFVQEVAGTHRYQFRHALTREAVYEDLSARERTRLHGRIADALRAAQVEAVTVVDHLIAAKREGEAVPLCLEAAAGAEKAQAYDEAVRLLEVAQPHIADPLEQARLAHRIATDVFRAGDMTRAVRLLEDSVRLLEQVRLHDLADAATVILHEARWRRGHVLPSSLAEATALRERLEARGHSANLVGIIEVQAELVRMLLMRGSARDEVSAALGRDATDFVSVELSREAVAVAESIGDREAWLRARMGEGADLVGFGHIDEGLAILEAVHLAARDEGFDWIAGQSLAYLVTLPMANVRLHESDRWALEIGALRSGFWRGACSQAVAATRFYQGRGREALALILPQLEQSVAAGDEARVRWCRSVAAAIYDELGDHENAASHLNEVPPNYGLAHLTRVIHATSTADESMFQHLCAEAEAHADEWIVVPWGVMRVVEELARRGEMERARALAARLTPVERDPGGMHYYRRMQGMLAGCGGDHAEGERLLREAAAGFEAGGALLVKWDTLSCLAELLEAVDPPRARDEWRAIFDGVRGSEMIQHAMQARDALARLGADVPGAGAAAGAPSEPQHTGERLVTVLFADVRGHTSRSQSMSPAELSASLAELQRWARTEIERERGIVDKFAGDAVMATFNVDGVGVDHAVQALRAAIALRDKALLHGVPIGVGVATGPAVVGALTEGANMSVVGQATNLASRLQAAAAAGEVLMDTEAHRRCAPWLESRHMVAELTEVALRGYDAPVRAYRIG